MKELIQVNYKENTTNARDVYDFIYQNRESKTSFSHWFKRAVNKYGFIEEIDFKPFLTESNGGRPIIDYVVTIDMAKELSMVASTGQGKKVRAYFLKCEEIARQHVITRAIGIETRKTLTDAIQESGENERMHGRGYSNFTRLVYSVTGLTGKYKLWKKGELMTQYKTFRECLNPNELKQVELAESLIKPLLELEKEYSDIKATIEPLFKTKELK